MKRPETPADRRFAFESFEDRLALTALALSDLADEWRETPIQTLAGATSSSGEGHGWAEVAYARNEFGLRGDGQTVAVIDSGIAYDHIALGGGLGAAYKVVGGVRRERGRPVRRHELRRGSAPVAREAVELLAAPIEPAQAALHRRA